MCCDTFLINSVLMSQRTLVVALPFVSNNKKMAEDFVLGHLFVLWLIALFLFCGRCCNVVLKVQPLILVVQ